MAVQFRRHAPLTLQNETIARRLGWTPESAITWREFLDQYPYQAAEIGERARQSLSSVA
jgi:hypothetical protein